MAYLVVCDLTTTDGLTTVLHHQHKVCGIALSPQMVPLPPLPVTQLTLMPCCDLVAVEVDILGSALLDSGVFALQQNSHPPCTSDTAKRKARAGTESDTIPRAVSLGPEVGTIDVADLTAHICHCQHNSLLLFGLCQRGRCPANDDAVDRVCTHWEDEACNVSTCGVQCRRSNHEPNNCDTKTSRDMPRALVVATRGPAKENASCPSKEERWASHHQGDCRAESKGLDNTV